MFVFHSYPLICRTLFHRQLCDPGSFGESSVASRRKRGPVAFRPRLSAGLALSTGRRCANYRVMSTADIMTNVIQRRFNRLRALFHKQHKVGAWSVRRCFGGVTNKMKGSFGSVAACRYRIRSTAALAGKAVIRPPIIDPLANLHRVLSTDYRSPRSSDRVAVECMLRGLL